MEFEKELRTQLARQAAAHSEHLQDVLNVQADELEQQCQREVHLQLLQERQLFQSEVAGWIARLQGIETAVEGQLHLSRFNFLIFHSYQVRLLVPTILSACIMKKHCGCNSFIASKEKCLILVDLVLVKLKSVECTHMEKKQQMRRKNIVHISYEVGCQDKPCIFLLSQYRDTRVFPCNPQHT